MSTIDIDEVNRELKAYQFELKTLLQSESGVNPRYLRFDAPNRRKDGKFSPIYGELIFTSENTGVFNDHTGGSFGQYNVTGGVKKLWESLDGNNKLIQCTHVQDINERSQYNICNVTIALNGHTVIIENIAVYK